MIGQNEAEHVRLNTKAFPCGWPLSKLGRNYMRVTVPLSLFCPSVPVCLLFHLCGTLKVETVSKDANTLTWNCQSYLVALWATHAAVSTFRHAARQYVALVFYSL